MIPSAETMTMFVTCPDHGLVESETLVCPKCGKNSAGLDPVMSSGPKVCDRPEAGYIYAPFVPIVFQDCRPWYLGVWHFAWWVSLFHRRRLARKSHIGRLARFVSPLVPPLFTTDDDCRSMLTGIWHLSWWRTRLRWRRQRGATLRLLKAKVRAMQAVVDGAPDRMRESREAVNAAARKCKDLLDKGHL